MKKQIENKKQLLEFDSQDDNDQNPADDYVGNNTKNSNSNYIYFKKIVPSNSPTFSPGYSTNTSKNDLLNVSYPPPTISLSPSSSPSGINPLLTTRACPGQTSDMIVNDFVKFTIEFDYEIVTDVRKQNVNDALKTLENRILNDIATSFLSCENKRTMNVRLQLYKDNIVRIDSAPSDVMDFSNVECMYDTGVTVAGDVRCTPIFGSMTLYSDCSSCPLPHSEILNAIKEGCDNDLYVDENFVKQVNFIGIRDSPVDHNVSHNHVKTGDLGFLLFFLVIVTFLLAYRRRRKEFGTVFIYQYGEHLNYSVSFETICFDDDLNELEKCKGPHLSGRLALSGEDK